MRTEMSQISVLNDNNNFAPILFQSLCEIGGKYFDASVFLVGSCAPSEKYLGPKQSPLISHNDLKKRWCAFIIRLKKKKGVSLPFSDRPEILENLCCFFFFVIFSFAVLNKIVKIKVSKYIVIVPKVYCVGTEGTCLPHICLHQNG